MKWIDTHPFVERALGAGWHHMTNHGSGMDSETYRRLWPEKIQVFGDEEDFFNRALLVDRTLALNSRVLQDGLVFVVKPSAFRDIVPSPKMESGTELQRCIAFVHDGGSYRGYCAHTIRAFLNAFDSSSCGLTLHEGICLGMQFPELLMAEDVDDKRVCLFGSECTPDPHIVPILVCESGKTVVDATTIFARKKMYPAIRSARVIPVT